ncbi:hypothetical protein HDU98_010828 [Podochytrium sp. JEL0797]|nr:hypothetical protein HDU98_010828 [Podochytrium sp. JEL0797]
MIHSLATLLTVLSAASLVSAGDAKQGWRVMKDPTGTQDGSSGAFCVHNILLPGNKLMCIERPHTHPYNFLNPNTNGRTSVIIDIDPTAGTISPTVNALYYNAFCAGHSQGANGEIHVVGGDPQSASIYQDNSITNATFTDNSFVDSGTFLVNGVKNVRQFYPGNGSWYENVTMSTGRWYPTVVTMGDGDLFIVSGDLKNLNFEDLSNTRNPTYEFYPSRFGQTEIQSEILRWAFPHNLYPISFQLPSGKLFLMVSNRTILIDPTVDPGPAETGANVTPMDAISIPDHAPWIYPHTPIGFLLPMKESTNYTATVMVCGGSKQSTNDASTDCVAIDADAPNARWQVKASLLTPRLMPEATLLPDGTVLITNGMQWGQAGGNAGDAEYASTPNFATELYDPVANAFTTVGRSSVMRSYHNGAVLLSDGSVVTTGNEMANYLDFWGNYEKLGPGGDQMVNQSTFATFANKPNCYPANPLGVCTNPYEYRIEQFTPSYLTNGPRPILKPFADNTLFTYNSTIGIALDPSGAPVSRITFVRYTTTTHSTNTDQRFIEPILLFANSTYAVVRVPPNGNIAPPGHWHIFALSKDGVPSVAQMALFGAGQATVVSVPPKSGGLRGGKGGVVVMVAVVLALVVAL